MIMISGEVISLQPVDRRHLDQTRIWANDYDLIRLLDRAWPVSDIQHEIWYKNLQGRTDCIYFAIETIADACYVGNVWLWDIDWRHRKAEVRIIIGDKTRFGQGIGTEAISSICNYAFERLNLHRIYAFVLATNPRARRTFEKAGFEVEGTLKADRWAGNHYTDVYLLGKLNEPAI